MPDRIETARLVLRRPVEADRDGYVAIFADPPVWNALSAPGDAFDPARVSRGFDGRLAHWDEHGFGFYMVDPGGRGEVAGFLACWHPSFVPDFAHEIEIGWSLRTPFQGQGFATEAATAVVPEAFERLAPDRLIHLIAPSNEPSQAVAKRLGSTIATRTSVPGTGMDLDVWELREKPEPEPSR
jgi:RimJ/RimL family protein N-acetyltransferase